MHDAGGRSEDASQNRRSQATSSGGRRGVEKTGRDSSGRVCRCRGLFLGSASDAIALSCLPHSREQIRPNAQIDLVPVSGQVTGLLHGRKNSESGFVSDPFTVLGVTHDASEAEIRSRYLELVKTYPPEREPDKFREVRAAYEAVKEPLSLAKRLANPPGDEIPEWADVIATQKQNPPRLSVQFLLSLGNRASESPSST
ncbi:J domain-containing protein [Lacunimicrobium album]